MAKILSIFVSAFIIWGMFSFAFNSQIKAQEKPKEIVLAHNQPTEHPVHKSLEIFKKELEKKSHGQIKVKIYPNGQLGSEREAIEMTQTNAIQMTKVSAGALESFSPSYSLFNAPYLFNSQDNYRHLMKEKKVQNAFFHSTFDNGFLGITYYDAGARNIYTKDKAIKNSKDLKGVKTRVQPSKTSVKLIKSLGGTPTPMDFGEVYTAMQSGVIDAAENNETALTTNNHGEIAKNYSYTEHAYVPDVLIMNKDTYNDLTKQQQKWLAEAAADSTKKHEVLWDKEVKHAKEVAKKDMGVKFHKVDKSSFKNASKPLRKEFAKDPKTKKYYDLIQKEEKKYEKSKTKH
ncbi:TRAP transporter substrate-binding protein [Staphylococcus durrellii]|uniref:TRAP transporter substrate-binding protein n=1 Tax=Staphylococcus durrellii TaxID=2781773 RepID=UPI0018A01A88|nr:TRAP transporter substrate-binding protein [Staphylococcus durrellii]MBF7015941.1 TRAP transporter substrate-binding protein [Staphylococcus durrellii]